MNKDIVIEGFAFPNEKAALKARHEAESVHYLKAQINMENPRIVMEFYRKLLAEEVFETPVGFVFLKELYDQIAPIPELCKMLPPIPAEKMVSLLSAENNSSSSAVGNSASESQASAAGNVVSEGRPFVAAGNVTPKGQPFAAAGNVTPKGQGQGMQDFGAAENQVPQGQGGEENFRQAEEMAVLYEEKLEQAKQKVRAVERKQRRAEEAVRKKKSSLRISLAVNFFLLLVAAGMVAIALLDSTPNIINYENKIQDKYAQWEMDLKEREAKVKDKERELNLE